MPEEAPSAVVTGAEGSAAPPAEAAPASTPDATVPTEGPEAKQPTPDPWESVKDHPDVKRRIEEEVQKRADALAQKRIAAEKRRDLKQRATRAVTSEDADTALEVAKQIAAEPDEDDDRPAWQTPAWREKLDAVQPYLNRLLKRPEYEALYAAKRADMDALYGRDPEAFAEWVDEETLGLRVKTAVGAAVGPAANALAKGITTEQVAQALQHVPVPLSGGGGANGALSWARYEAMSWDEKHALRATPEGRRQIDEMIARETRG